MRTLPILALLSIAALAQPAERPNLLLITLDTTRADHLGSYGMRNARTPVLDALAAKGVRFAQAHTHVPLTLPAHAVMFSGRLPSTLNLHVNGSRLGEGVETLATHLRRRGYWTGAVVGSVILHRDYGLAGGFTAYDDRMTIAPGGGGAPEERRAEEVTATALQLVRGAAAPYFLWVHYYDPHFDYRPPPPYQRTYDDEIAYMDASIGRLLEGLKAKGLLGNTLIVVAGDHGEGLGDRGETQHGVFLYESTLRVPLLMRWDGHIKAGTTVDALCGLVDLAPTALDLMAQGALAKTDGVSLKPTKPTSDTCHSRNASCLTTGRWS